MKTLLSPDLDAQPLLLVDCEARSREALEKNLTRMGIRWHHLTGDEALPPLTPCAVLVELEAFASPLTLSQINLAGIPVIALTSHEGLYQVQRALELGATALLTKPITQRAIYTTLMQTCNLAYDESIFIDDNKVNAQAAYNLGITGILYKNPKSFERALRACGIELD